MTKTKKITIHLKRSLAPKYFAALKKMEASITKGKSSDEPSFIPFMVTCAAALECLLNDHLIEYSFEMFGPDNYRRFAKAMLSINLRGKLDCIIPLLSGNKFIIRKDSQTYQQLARLITIRNNLMHNKNFLEEFEADIDEGRMDTISLKVTKDVYKKMEDPDLSRDDCAAFLHALQDLNHILSSGEEWQENETVVKNNEFE